MMVSVRVAFIRERCGAAWCCSAWQSGWGDEKAHSPCLRRTREGIALSCTIPGPLAFECGTIVNPDNLRNQIEGATVMGLGGALFEAICWQNGHLLSDRMPRYRVPRFSDVPPIDVVLMDRKDLPPAGAGETPLIAVAPALANAICAATGRRLRALP